MVLPLLPQSQALEEALSIQSSPSSPPAFGSPEGAGALLRKQELVTQNELLKQQVRLRAAGPFLKANKGMESHEPAVGIHFLSAGWSPAWQ
jgi:hypothetical protein